MTSTFRAHPTPSPTSQRDRLSQAGVRRQLHPRAEAAAARAIQTQQSFTRLAGYSAAVGRTMLLLNCTARQASCWQLQSCCSQVGCWPGQQVDEGVQVCWAQSCTHRAPATCSHQCTPSASAVSLVLLLYVVTGSNANHSLSAKQTVAAYEA